MKSLKVLAVCYFLLGPIMSAEAGRGRRFQSGCPGGRCGVQSVYPGAQAASAPACPGGVCPAQAAPQMLPMPQPVARPVNVGSVNYLGPVSGSASPLDQVNARRAAAGLTPYIEDPQLTAGAKACAEYRAAHGIAGHANDFRFLAPGVMKYGPPDQNGVCQGLVIAGADGRRSSADFATCAMTDNYTYAGAYTAIGANGRHFHQLFVR